MMMGFMDKVMVAAIGLLVAGLVALIGLIIASLVVEAGEQDYVRTHRCMLVERQEGYYTHDLLLIGKVFLPHTSWHSPRGRFICEDGTQHWVNVQ